MFTSFSYNLLFYGQFDRSPTTCEWKQKTEIRATAQHAYEQRAMTIYDNNVHKDYNVKSNIEQGSDEA